jgi:YHS domain-containing protein
VKQPLILVRWPAVRSSLVQMKRLTAPAAILLFAVACGGSKSATPEATTTDAELAGMQTIESVDPRPKVVDAPLVLSDEAPPPKPKQLPWQPPVVVVLTPEDEKVRAALPFSPAIAMDPVNGDKISIRAATPTFEYKGRVYYFANEENKRMFAANPEAATKGGYTKL